ncbi:unnamed protein product, partial [Ectocarpus fasciculatus]
LCSGDAPVALSAVDEEASCCSSSGCSTRGGGDRMTPTSARSAPAAGPEGEDGRKSRRKSAAATATTKKRGASPSSADVAGVTRAPAVAAAAATAAGKSSRAPPRQRRQPPAVPPPSASGNHRDDDGSGLDLDTDSSFEYDDLDDVWSDEDEEDDGGWSNDDDDDDEDDWARGAAGGPGGRAGRRTGRGGEPPKASKMGRASAMSMSSMRDRLNRARQRASVAYREAKSLMSSEMEGVVLKATRPDDLPVKPKHLEALMRPTVEMPKEFNVYLPVVRKLWSKMADKEWRVSAKALYILHRFAADGSTEHASNLKESVAVLRTHHDSRRKVNYFDMDTICDVKAPSWSGEDVAPMAEFLQVYADFVLRRTTQFGPGFAELLDAFTMLLGGGEVMTAVAGLVSVGSKCCHLREEQEGAIAVAAAVQVAHDIRDLVEVCAAQLDYLAREWDARSTYRREVNEWYAFLYENRRPVEALIDRANELAERHKLVAVRPLAATPLVLKLRDEEVALEEQAALEAKQEQYSLDEGEEEEVEDLDQPSTDAYQRRPAALEAGKRHARGFNGTGGGGGGGGRSSSGGGGDGGVGVTTSRPQRDAGAREESVPPPSAPAPVAARARGTDAKDRGTGVRPSPPAGGSASPTQKRSVSSGARASSGTARRPAARRPPGGGSATAEAARARGREEGEEGGGGGGGGGVRKTPLGGGGDSAVDGDGVTSRVSKRRRSSSSSSSSAQARREEERRAGAPLAKGGERHAAAAAASAAVADVGPAPASSSSRSSRPHSSSASSKKTRKSKRESLENRPRSG